MELSAQFLNYLILNNENNINQYLFIYMHICAYISNHHHHRSKYRCKYIYIYVYQIRQLNFICQLIFFGQIANFSDLILFFFIVGRFLDVCTLLLGMRTMSRNCLFGWIRMPTCRLCWWSEIHIFHHVRTHVDVLEVKIAFIIARKEIM